MAPYKPRGLQSYYRSGREKQYFSATKKRQKRIPMATLVRDMPVSTINRIPFAGMPLRKLVRMRYSDDIAITFATAATASAYVLRLNSIHDPDFTGTGHQPMGHDEWVQFYEHYTVLSAKVRADFYGISSNPQQNASVGIMFSHDSNVKTNGDNIIEGGRASWKRLGTREGGPSSSTVTKYWSAKKWFGNYNQREKYAALFGANPTEVVYAHLFGIPVAENSLANETIRVRFVIDYIVLMDTPRDLTQS